MTTPSFNALSRTSIREIVLSSKNLNSSSNVANLIIVDILKYLIALCYHWHTLSISFLLEW